MPTKDRIYPNIRIVKFTSNFLVKDRPGIYITQNGRNKELIKRSRCEYRYYIGFTIEKFEFSSAAFNLINFCPYCGKNLYEFYNKDEYTNEIEGITFKI